MKNSPIEHGTIFVNDNLLIYEQVDREDHIYYPNDEITFTVLCINNSNEKLKNIIIKDILPKEVVPLNEDGYIIETNKGKITQKNNEILVHVEELDAKENILLTIKGKVVV